MDAADPEELPKKLIYNAGTDVVQEHRPRQIKPRKINFLCKCGRTLKTKDSPATADPFSIRLRNAALKIAAHLGNRIRPIKASLEWDVCPAPLKKRRPGMQK